MTTRTKIKIRTQRGVEIRDVPAHTVRNGLAVTPTVGVDRSGGYRWALTHVGSGHHLGLYLNQRAAVKGLGALLETGIPWTRPRAEIATPANRERAYVAVRDTGGRPS